MIPDHRNNEMMIKGVAIAFVAIFMAAMSFTFVMAVYGSAALAIR